MKYQSTEELYDEFGEQYHKYRKNSSNFYNSCIDMPAVFNMLGKVRNKKVLDVGCGSGFYSNELKKRGAKVSGIDVSKTLIEIAKREVKGVDFKVADANKLPFANSNFDLVVSALTFHYLKNWNNALKEIRRVLKPNGLFVFSIDNPFRECREIRLIDGKQYKIIGSSWEAQDVVGDYFTERTLKESIMPGMIVTTYHKTFGTIINTLAKNKFVIEQYTDAKPIPKGKKIDPIAYKIFSKLPLFSVFKVRKENNS